ncbi:MAG: universal stress protein [Actinomycetia bacterium]|nr:universal stress protein [Actinomycetes bacterium]MCP4958553.1 universal stress protein [Actinomycetes bacterium]
MQHFENILYCPFGERGNETAMRRIIHLAGGRHPKIHLLDVVPPGQRHVARRSLVDLARLHPATKDVEVEMSVESGNRTDAIAGRIEECGHDLVVITPEDDSGAQKATARLVRECRIPLLVLRSNPYRNERVLAAVNPTSRRRELNIEVLAASRLVADRLDCELDVVHAWQLYGEPGMRDSGYVQVGDEEIEAKLAIEREIRRVELEKMLTDPRVGFEPGQTHLPKGRMVPSVAQVVRHVHASMLVVGSAGRTGWRRLVMGNSAEKLVEEVPCSVMVVS